MARLSTYYHLDYSGGLNDSASKRQIGRNEAAILRNWDITLQGQLRRRKGLTAKGQSLKHEIDGLHGYVRTGGKDLLALAHGGLYYLNQATWTLLDSGFTSGKKMAIVTCPLNNKVYLSNDTDTLHSWDRASTTEDDCLTDLGATVPHGNILRWHKNHMFTLNNTKVSDTVYPHRLYWSEMANPDTWDTTNDFIELPGGGRAITMADMGDALVIFKEHSISYLTGWGDEDWRITASSSNTANLDESVGCIAPFGVTRVGNEVWFIDDEGIIRRLYQTDFDAFRRDIISTKLATTLSGLNKVQLSKTVATTFDDKVMFAVPTGSSTDNNLVLVFDLIAAKRSGGEAWTTYTGWQPSALAVYPTSTTIDLYLGDTSGQVYLHDGKDDNGVAIDARWDGKQDDYDAPDRFKRYKYGYMRAENQGDIDVTVHASIDGAPFAQLEEFKLQGSGSTLGPTGSFLLGPTGGARLSGGEMLEEKYYFAQGGGTVTGKAVQMSLRHQVVDENPVLDTFTNHFKKRSLR